MYELSDEELEKRGIRQFPKTLLEAMTAFEEDDLGRRVMGDELYRSYIDLKNRSGGRITTPSRSGKSTSI